MHARCMHHTAARSLPPPPTMQSAAFSIPVAPPFAQPCMCSSPRRRKRVIQQATGAALAGAAAFLLQTTQPPHDLPPHAVLATAYVTESKSIPVTLWPESAPRTLIPRPKRRPIRPTPPRSAQVEFQMMSRMAVAIVCGAIIGIERRAASASAGIRTLSLVSLGSAIFSLTSLHGLGGDPARMGAAISTGIGFLGSGAINGDNLGSRRQLVTAASIWIAAALGVAAASGLYSMAVMGAIVTVWILRWQLLQKLTRVFAASVVVQIRRWFKLGKEVGSGSGSEGRVSRTEDKGRVEVDYESWQR